MNIYYVCMYDIAYGEMMVLSHTYYLAGRYFLYCKLISLTWHAQQYNTGRCGGRMNDFGFPFCNDFHCCCSHSSFNGTGRITCDRELRWASAWMQEFRMMLLKYLVRRKEFAITVSENILQTKLYIKIFFYYTINLLIVETWILVGFTDARIHL